MNCLAWSVCWEIEGGLQARLRCDGLPETSKKTVKDVAVRRWQVWFVVRSRASCKDVKDVSQKNNGSGDDEKLCSVGDSIVTNAVGPIIRISIRHCGSRKCANFEVVVWSGPPPPAGCGVPR